MKLLEPLVRRSERTGSMSFGEWLGVASNQYAFNGNQYSLPVQTTMTGQKAEPIGGSFEGYVNGGLFGNSVIFSLASIRMRVFAEARLQWQRLEHGVPGDLFSTPDLGLFEHPWPGGTTGDLLSRMELIEQFAGNCYVLRVDDELVILRSDWTDILLTERYLPTGEQVGYRKVGYSYHEGGHAKDQRGVILLPDEVAHFAPQPDPLATYRGMSWLTPVIREIQADGAATSHKLAFFENAATPNLAVSLPKEVTPEQFSAFVEKMDDTHQGTANAYKTLYTGGGADVTVIGADMRQLDFKVTQGAGETRLAAAAGVPPVVAGLSEGMQGSSLNAGNFGQARRQFGDTTLSNLWTNAAGSLEVLISPPGGARLWCDRRHIPFLREDQKDEADIQSTQAQSIRTLVDAGFGSDDVIAAIQNKDWGILKGKHSGLFSVQLQEPGASAPPAARSSSDLRGEPITVYPPNVDVQITNQMPPLKRADQPAPVVNVNVPVPSVHVENLVPVPSVSVEAPVVSVAAPLVTNEVHMPPEQKVTRRVVRDAAGLVTKVVEE